MAENEEAEKPHFTSRKYTQGFIDALEIILQFYDAGKKKKECKACPLIEKATYLLECANKQKYLQILNDAGALEIA